MTKIINEESLSKLCKKAQDLALLEADNLLGQLDLTPEEQIFALHGATKIFEMLYKEFWGKKHTMRNHTLASTMALALAMTDALDFHTSRLMDEAFEGE